MLNDNRRTRKKEPQHQTQSKILKSSDPNSYVGKTLQRTAEAALAPSSRARGNTRPGAEVHWYFLLSCQSRKLIHVAPIIGIFVSVATCVLT